MVKRKSLGQVKVIYHRQILNAKFPVGTEFFFVSSCNLDLIALTRKVKINSAISSRPTIDLESEY